MKNIKSVAVYVALLLAGLAVGYAVPRVPSWLHRNYVEGDYSAYFHDEHTRVIVFGTKSCSFCKRAEAYMKTRGITYAFEDVESSPSSAASHAKLGIGGVPVVIIGNRVVQGFRPDDYAEALRRLN